jgi:hypothetical protein
MRSTREYEISEDPLASFVQDECTKSSIRWCAVSDFHHNYEQNCAEMGAEPLTAKALTMRLVAEHGVSSGRHTKLKHRIYRGIDLSEAPRRVGVVTGTDLTTNRQYRPDARACACNVEFHPESVTRHQAVLVLIRGVASEPPPPLSALDNAALSQQANGLTRRWSTSQAKDSAFTAATSAPAGCGSANTKPNAPKLPDSASAAPSSSNAVLLLMNAVARSITACVPGRPCASR